MIENTIDNHLANAERAFMENQMDNGNVNRQTRLLCADEVKWVDRGNATFSQAAIAAAKDDDGQQSIKEEGCVIVSVRCESNPSEEC